MSGLRDLAAQATPGPWGVTNEFDDPYVIGIHPIADPDICLAMDIDPDDARLIALAPDLALLCADAMEAHAEWANPDAEDSSDTRRLNELLARWAELNARAGGGA